MISNKRKTTQKGFTLVEVLVSVAIIVIISSIAISYSSSIRSNLTLLRTQSQLVTMVNHAKSLTLNFQLDPPDGFKICAYGFNVDETRDEDEFIVFRDLVISDSDPNVDQNCEEDAEHVYDPSKEDNDGNKLERLPGRLNNFSLDTSILEIRDTPGKTRLENVVFIPPIPEVIVKNNAGQKVEVPPFPSFRIRIKDNPGTRFDLSVDNSGQVTIE